MKISEPKLEYKGYYVIALYENKKWHVNIKLGEEKFHLVGKTLYHIRRDFPKMIEKWVGNQQ